MTVEADIAAEEARNKRFQPIAKILKKQNTKKQLREFAKEPSVKTFPPLVQLPDEAARPCGRI